MLSYRRTYARWLYDDGLPVDAISQNMGHRDVGQTWHYIGPADVADREPPALFVFNVF
ncbi:hypothetical protein ACFLYO_01895 [Chloroflexota bacterium]